MSLFWLRFLTFLPHNIFFKIVSRAENLWKWRPESDLCQWFLLHVVCNVLQRLMTNAVWHRTCDELSEPINWYKEKPQFDQHLQTQAGSQRRKPVTIRFCVIHFNYRLISAFWFQRFGSDWADLEETGDHMLLWQLEHPSAYLPTNPIVCLLGDSHTSSNTINEKLRRKRNLPLDPSLPSHPEKLCQENHTRKSRQGNVDVAASTPRLLIGASPLWPRHNHLQELSCGVTWSRCGGVKGLHRVESPRAPSCVLLYSQFIIQFSAIWRLTMFSALRGY